jgi:hypothetical protein
MVDYPITDYDALRARDLERMNPDWFSLLAVNLEKKIRLNLYSRNYGGPVYFISNNEELDYKTIVKFEWKKLKKGVLSRNPRYVDTNPKRIQHEHDICKFLYDNDVNVPEPLGVFNFSAFDKKWIKFPYRNRNFPGFVMEHIKGVNYWDGDILTGTMERIEKAHKEELKKVRSLGISDNDLDLDNTIWVPEKEKLYLIDFGECLFPGESSSDFWN